MPENETYNGYVNRETWAFNLHWQNDYNLYFAVLDYARNGLLRRVPNMSTQTLGRNVRDHVQQWCTDGRADAIGWQDDSYSIDPKVLEAMGREVGSFWRVSDTEVGEAVVESLDAEFGSD